MLNKSIDFCQIKKQWLVPRKNEFGPRALGNNLFYRPKSEKMQKNLNIKVKYRESFRPFAPSILKDHLPEWFDITTDSPYMLLVIILNQIKKLK